MSQQSAWKGAPLPVPYVGLANTGEGGALNACVQLLLHTPIFVEELSKCEMLSPLNSLLSYLEQICSGMRAAKNGVYHVSKDFHNSFFLGLGSDSSSYFLKIICQLVHEYCSMFGGQYEDAPFIKLLDGGLEEHGKCMECNQPSQVTGTQLLLNVPIIGMVSVANAIRLFLMETGKSERWCTFCSKSTECVINYNLQSAPPLLGIKLMRFCGEGKHVNDHLSHSEELLLPSGWRYNFSGSVLHIGETLLSGQSMTLLKCPSNCSFRLISDSHVKNVSYTSVQSSDAISSKSYLLLYRRMEIMSTPMCDVSHISLDVLNVTQENAAVTFSSKCFYSSNSKMHSSCKRKKNQSHPNSLNVKRVLSFSFEAPHEAANNTLFSKSSPQNPLQVSQDIFGAQSNENESAEKDDADGNENDTSYVSILPPDNPSQATEKRKAKKMKARAINFDDNSSNCCTKTNKSDSFSSSLGSASQNRRKTRLHQRGRTRNVEVVRVVVRYEICVKMPEAKFKFFTGLTQYNFSVLFDLIGGDEAIKLIKYDYQDKTPTKTLPTRQFSSENRLFLMLIRMRRGVPVEDLGYIFGITDTHVTRILNAMIRVTYETLILLQPHMFITAEEQKKHMPAPFKRFKNLRVIIDGAEFHIQRPSGFQQQGNTFSAYKHYNTEKYLIGISCYGSIIFCSSGFEGSMSDKEILKASGMMDYLQKGDTVMADRGFNVKSELAEIGVDLVKPAHFKKKKQSLNPKDEVMTRDTASARIYVEHAIKSIKDWRLMRNIIPMNIHDLLPDMVFIAAFLSNFNKPYIKLSNVNKD